MVFFVKSKESRSRWYVLLLGNSTDEKDKTVIITDFLDDSSFEFDFPTSGVELATRGSENKIYAENPMLTNFKL